MVKKITPFEMVVSSITPAIGNRLKNIPANIKDNLQEIRLRINRPIALCCAEDTYYLTKNGCVTNTFLSEQMLTASGRELSETFNTICNYSVYAKQNEIKNGFVTINGGHRAGICGTAVIENNKIINIRNISSINIRISTEHKGCGNIVINKINDLNCGFLLCGVPCSGKTTVLRDLARVYSTDYNKKVAVIDQRSEIAGTCNGIPYKDVGMSDVLDGYSKSDGFEHALRCMSPDVIICDELGSESDCISLENAVNSGAAVIASVHCANAHELKSKPILGKLLKSGAFKYAVFLDSRKNPGKINSVVNVNELHL